MTMPIVPAIVLQHVDDAAMLHANRTFLTTAPHGAVRYLRRFDDRLVAHLDGIATAGKHGQAVLNSALDPVWAGNLFVATVSAMTEGHQRLEPLVDLAQATPGALTGFFSAFGWAERETLQGTVARLLSSEAPFRRLIGVAACGLHRVDPGLANGGWLRDQDRAVRARAVRAAGELGRSELLTELSGASKDTDDWTHFWVSWSAVLLGDRNRALDTLIQAGFTEGSQRARAFRLALQAMTTAAAHARLQELGGKAEELRWLIQGSGINGDPIYIPWLMKHMADDKTARVAGEAFSLITGTDLALLDLERKPPDDFESGPNDDPDDPNVEMDADDGLSWPDPDRIRNWWAASGVRFQGGQRYFMGAPVTREHCIGVLKNGYQRQRILAAHYLCLLDPGTPLFNTSAPAWRQQRLLAKMG